MKYYLGTSYVLARTDKKIDSLSICYKSQDLTKDSTFLVFTRIRIANKGRREIKEIDYNQSLPFGLRVTNCNIIDVRIVDERSNSLSKYLKPHIVDSNTIWFDKIAFDCNDEVSFDVCLIYKFGKFPDYTSLGKITGEKEIPVLLEGEDEYVDWELVGMIGLLIAIEVPIVLLLVWLFFLLMKYFRKNYAKRKIYRTDLNSNLTKVQICFVELFVFFGKRDFLKLLNGFSIGDKFINSEMEIITAYSKVNSTREGKILFFFSRKINYESPFARYYESLIDQGLLFKNEDGTIGITKELKDEVTSVLSKFK